VEIDRAEAAERLRQLHESMDATRIARSARESELASAHIEHDWRARSVRSREQELAALEARLLSLQELDAARAEYSDGARAVLAEANGHVGQQGAIADYLEVDPGYERAVEACLGALCVECRVERRITLRRALNCFVSAARPLRVHRHVRADPDVVFGAPHRAPPSRLLASSRSPRSCA
jgi:chromosome segregation protein